MMPSTAAMNFAKKPIVWNMWTRSKETAPSAERLELVIDGDEARLLLAQRVRPRLPHRGKPNYLDGPQHCHSFDHPPIAYTPPSKPVSWPGQSS